MKKLTALIFATLIIVSALVVAFSQPVGATPKESAQVTLSSVFSAGNSSGNETIVPGSENGLIVAFGGVVGIILILTIILLRVLSKRKKRMS